MRERLLDGAWMSTSWRLLQFPLTFARSTAQSQILARDFICALLTIESAVFTKRNKNVQNVVHTRVTAIFFRYPIM